MLKIGIAGLGRGRTAFVFDEFPDCRVTALCDPAEERLNQVAEERGIDRRVTRFEDLLDSGVDAIFLATPMPLHASQAAAALDAGIHVLSEVAAGFTWRDLWLLAEAAHRSTATYMLAENYCYMRHVMLVRALAEAGVFGDIYYGESEYLQELRGPVEQPGPGRTWRACLHLVPGNNYPTHNVGPLCQILKEPVRDVACFGSGNHTIPGRALEDRTITVGHTPSGKLVQMGYDLVSHRPQSVQYYGIQGTRGCYESPRGLGDDHKVYIVGECERGQWRPLWDYEHHLPGWYREMEDKARASGFDISDYCCASEFRAAVAEARAPEVGVWMALNLSAIIPATHDSLAAGGAVIPIPDFQAEVEGGASRHGKVWPDA